MFALAACVQPVQPAPIEEMPVIEEEEPVTEVIEAILPPVAEPEEEPAAETEDTSVQESSDFIWEERNGMIAITGYTGHKKVLVIPDAINGLPVERIDRRAFRGADMEELVIPGSVKVIGDSAFRNCENLKKVTLEDGIVDIEVYAFAYNDNLTSINLPDTLHVVNCDTFFGCDRVKFDTPPGSFAEEYLEMCKFFNAHPYAMYMSGNPG